MSYKLDIVDEKIISLLKENSRIKYKELAKKIGNISDVGVKKRVNKLIEKGIIKKFTIEYEINKKYKILLLIKGEPKNKEKFNKTIGKYDYFGIFYFDSFEEYNEFIKELGEDIECYPQIMLKE